MTLLSNVFAFARQPGATRAPVTLVELVNRSPDAPEHDIWAALETDLGFIRLLRPNGVIQQGMSDWAELIRWLKTEVSAWGATAAPSIAQFKAILAFSQWMDQWGNCWEEIAHAATPSALLIKNLRSAAAGSRLDLIIPPTSQVWERRLLAKFLAADEQRAWDVIDDMRRSIFETFNAPLVTAQSCRALSHLDFPALLLATSTAANLMTAYAMVSLLTPVLAVELAASTSNEHVRFAATMRLTEDRQLRFTPALAARFADVFIQVAADVDRWKVWMKTCFTYPIRYAPLHQSLGLALAQLNPSYQQSYLDALNLEDNSNGRLLTTICFEAFAQVAALPERQKLWAIAFEKWTAWDFGGMAGQTVVRSVVDFAVVGHLVEGMSSLEARNTRRLARGALLATEIEWHRDVSALKRSLYTRASRLQPHLHAAWIRRRPTLQWLDMSNPRLPKRYRTAYRAHKI